MRRRIAVVALAAATMIAACADGDDTRYDRAATESCLRENGYSPEEWPPEMLPFHGGPAADGVLRVESGDTEIGIAFDADADEAEERVGALETTASQFAPNVWFDVFEQKENVVYWARGGRPDEPLKAVDNCLTE